MKLLILIISILTFQCLVATSRVCNVDDESALLSFKSGITHDPSGMLSSWKPKTDCCTWAGITCLSNDRVTALSLSGQANDPNSYLSGTLSPSLAKLNDLDGLYLLNTKNITGKFPVFLYGLPKLLYVYLDNNQLSGPIPSDISKLGTQLDVLSIGGNRFTGAIPASISSLTGLTRLQLGGNLITGKLPIGIRSLRNLTFLELQSNKLSRPIPEIFSSLPQLRYLNLSHNQFTGKIPSSISSLASSLAYLELGHNSLAGKIPSFLGNFQTLDTLDLSWNNLTGTVPKTFQNLTKIFNLDLSHNSLVDPFPVMNVKGIESLDLSYNNFNLGKIPNWVTSSPIIYSLKLAKCGIKINLTNWNPKETYFYDYIDLSENQITGSPVTLLNRTELLVGFRASGNKLSFDLGKLKIVETLKDLDLSRNLVTGGVPSSVSGLERLNLSKNRLCGKLPPTKFPASSFEGNDCLCGSPLPACKKG
ncbi:LRR receptor-like serine/threonine-protein kinase FLS2 [Linum grandiflorum]